jgi:predicted amidohydrolase
MNITINQIALSDYQPGSNTANVLALLAEQASHTGFILFPELCLTGFPTAQNLDQLWQASEACLDRIIEKSRSCSATVVLGHLERQGQHYFNACYYIRDGHILHIHRKRRLWLDDIGIFESGTEDRTCQIDAIRCGSQICFDLEFPEGCRTLAKQGVDLILMPNGNMQPYGNTHFVLSQARAIENQCFVVTCNRVGSGHGGNFVGESLAVSPTGKILAHLSDKEESVSIAIDINDVQESRKTYNYIKTL